ncbi:MAG TPA: hypothetical protein VK171_11880, partial [Fimbriimonas sp.]|nr:hypothetical protein [Fimbriimonas sp.]
AMVGVATRIQPPAPGGEQIKVDVVFKNCVSIGEYAPYPETGAFLSVRKETVQEWIDTKARILSYSEGNWINLDDPKERFFDDTLNRITSVEEAIKRMRKISRDNPEIDRVKVFNRPLSDEEAKRLDADRGAYIAVPCNRTLEKWAIGAMKSSEWSLRSSGTYALVHFHSPENEKRVRQMLTDPFKAAGDRGKESYPVRETAKRVLEYWGYREE